MKSTKVLALVLAICSLMVIQSCDDDAIDTPSPSPSITASPFSVTIDENPMLNQSLGKVSATSDDGAALTYSMLTVGDANAFAINSNTGELTVADATLFDYETKPILTATYEASNGVDTEQSTITVMLNDVNDNPGTVPFITTWEIKSVNLDDSVGFEIALNDIAYEYDAVIDWGDGTQTSYKGTKERNTYETVFHLYQSTGTYDISVSGMFPTGGFNCYASNDGAIFELKAVKQWGNIQWKATDYLFYQAPNFTIPNPQTERPDLSKTISMDGMFANSKFNGDISTWDVSNVESFIYTFSGTENFNVDISDWDMSRAKRLFEMFGGAKAFNQPIGSWDVSNVEYFVSMFANTKAFNADLSQWNTSSAIDMKTMFTGAEAFNQPIGDWNTENVTNMQNMFAGALEFNQPIDSWNVSNVRLMLGMFSRTNKFNQPLDNWNVSSVTNMASMFADAIAFNQPLGNWDVSSVTGMGFMFSGASQFNQDLSQWGTKMGAVTNVFNMFEDASSFNQSLADWDLSNLTGFGLVNMLDRCGMDVANYDATLNGWANNPSTPSGFRLSATDLKYSGAGEVGRNKLINDKGWAIFGDSKQ